VLACLVVLVLAVGGLLALRAVSTRPVLAAGTSAPRARRRNASRDAVRRSSSHASRAPGPLCERAFGFIPHRADGQALCLFGRRARAFARVLDPARSAPALC